ncbi:MAG: DegT/DnrJ/EryC1/StrS family aminotransferase [Magnetospirillum gryphiswaldense]|nr:DegT/DnrJ/EryC1/StrS family aminotransferase [Magnetospirillum gryphiswaldense]
MTAWPRFKFYGTPAIFTSVLRDVLSGRIHSGDDVSRLERAVSQMTGSGNAVAVPQARVGLYLAIKALLARTSRRKVVMSPYTIYDVVNMVVCAGGIPIFADVDPRSGNLSAAAVQAALDDDTALVLVTHLHGMMADLSALIPLCAAHGALLIEDAAQAFGGRWTDRMAGTLGHVGVFSFGRAKNINCFFGGMVVTNDDALAAEMRQATGDWPQIPTGLLLKRVVHCAVIALAVSRLVFPWLTRHVFRYLALVGERKGAALFSTERNPIIRSRLPSEWHRRLTPMQGRIALKQIAEIDHQQEKRLAIVRVYAEGLRDIPQISLPVSMPDAQDIFLAYPIQVPDRMACQEHLLRAGLDVVIQHIGNCADYPVFSAYRHDCPQARQVAAAVLLLPTYPGYPLDQAHETVRQLQAYFAPKPADREK